MNLIGKSLVLLPLFLSASLYCPAPTNAQQKQAVDPWYFAPKNRDGWKESKPQRSYRVKPILVPQCTGELKTVRFKKIEWGEAQLIVGNAMEETKGYSPYLVRGLMINDGSGVFRIYQKGSAILVTHGGLGEFRFWTKQPLVVILRNPPTQVYTIAQTAL